MLRPQTQRQWVSAAVVLVSATMMISLGGVRVLKDGSFWLDEAAIAYNLLSMPTLELFGRLDTGHQFPRLYLALINQLRLVFGYETAVLRALPFGFFVAGVLLWHRVLWLRFRERPSLLALGAVLCVVPGVWFVYGAMFKQYSLDVFLALLPFLLRDETLDRRWRKGEGFWRLLPWLLPCLFSLSYGIAFLGRFVGYWLGTARARGWVPPLRATALLAAGLAAVLLASWWIDLRHAFLENTAFEYWAWRGCIATGDPAADARLVGMWAFGWFGASMTFSGKVGLHLAAQVALIGAFVLGAGVLLAGAFRPRVETAEMAAWGTRGLSALATVAGLQAAGLLVDYPLCAGRLTLFAYFSLVLVMLEGLAFLVRAAPTRVTKLAAEGVALVLLAAAVPAARATVEQMWFVDPRENIRLLLPAIATMPERKIVVGACTENQALTLPEWLGRDDIFHVDVARRNAETQWPTEREFWLVATNHGFCPAWTDVTRKQAVLFRLVSRPDPTITLHHVIMPAPRTRTR